MEEPEVFQDQDYEAIIENLDEKFVDDHENEQLCQTFGPRQEEMGIEWIRASKLPLCTNDEGDVEFLRKEMEDDEGNMVTVNLEREYSRGGTDSTMMDACLATASWLLENKPMSIFHEQNDNVQIQNGIWMVPLCINGSWIRVVMSDKVPCYEYEPIYCKSRSGAVWSMMLEKALAKYHGGYHKIQEYPLDWQ